MKTVSIAALSLSLALALGACAQTGGETRSYGNDALPSAEVAAFQRTHARLGYADARIEYDTNNCAVYQGRAADGQVRREPLRNPDNSTICRPR